MTLLDQTELPGVVGIQGQVAAAHGGGDHVGLSLIDDSSSELGPVERLFPESLDLCREPSATVFPVESGLHDISFPHTTFRGRRELFVRRVSRDGKPLLNP